MAITDALLPEFDQEMATTRRVLERVSDDTLGWKPHAKSWSMPRAACVRSFVMNHVIHHRGQLRVYLRLNNIPAARSRRRVRDPALP
ncbi:MAG: hypothetical protein HY048_16920 [Acidobacteria bacterium]|nr:hypothetical protein [Acidobacteriota bacterium]